MSPRCAKSFGCTGYYVERFDYFSRLLEPRPRFKIVLRAFCRAFAIKTGRDVNLGALAAISGESEGMGFTGGIRDSQGLKKRDFFFLENYLGWQHWAGTPHHPLAQN